METPVFDNIASFFDGLVQQHGCTWEALDYRKKQNQASRFEVMAGLANFNGSTILDVGCGFAEFADYIAGRQVLRYSGIDLSPAVIGEARKRRPDLDLLVGNVLTAQLDLHDYVIANGIFYLLGLEAPTLMRQIISRMFELSHRGIAFSSLSTWAKNSQPGEYHADPIEILQFCRTLSGRVVLRHDYHPADFTIYVYKTYAST